jgi:hypothetical protein
VSKLKNLANNVVLVECKSKTNHDILEKKVGKLSMVTVECPKRKLLTLLLMFVPKELEDDEIRHHSSPKQPVSYRRFST